MSGSIIDDVLEKLKTGIYSIENIPRDELAAFSRQLETLDEAAYIQVYNELYQISSLRGVEGREPGVPDPAFMSLMESKLDAMDKEAPVVTMQRSYTWKRWAVAAAAVLVLVFAGMHYFLADRRPTDAGPVSIVHTSSPPSLIQPGSDKAVLTLSDGSTVVLDSVRKGELASQANTKVVKLSGGTLAYEKMSAGNSEAPPPCNTLSTPRGGQFFLILSDGTKVWLNAASSIRFPVAFKGKERRVEVLGEAYFEVAADKARPFYVQAKDMKVEVLGTHFDVMTYDDENRMTATLLEGAVRVTRDNGSDILRPGQQARFDKVAGSMKIAAVNTEEVVAWKQGRFEFDGADIGSILRQLSRWYDVVIDFAGKRPSDAHFSGSISRKAPVAEVLHILELGGARFKIEGKKIIVL